jgi:SAM-dependent methyltransferase
VSPAASGNYSQFIAPEQYDQWYCTPRGEWIGRTEAALLEALIGLRPGESLLDVGCGTGYFIQALTPLAGLAVGADRDQAMLHYAALHRGGGRSWLVADARALPFAQDSFDVVISVAALCFVRDEVLALREMLRVARRRVVLGLLNRHSVLYLQRGRGAGQGGYRGAHWHCVAEARSLFDGLAAIDVTVRSAVHLPSGGRFARWIEPVLGLWQPGFGSFLAVAVDKTRRTAVSVSTNA